MTDNLALWNVLGKTDPKHTKPFKRAGGFGGTAIKPIYTEQKMTEHFGPCGIGWGINEPVYQVVPASDGQIAVYCTTSIWVNHEGKVSAPIYGVGGDLVVVKQSGGLRTDDEAFKKAFTDAMGNAMKHLGMSADVHMGRFDDSKYVRDREAEEAETQRTGPYWDARFAVRDAKTLDVAQDAFAAGWKATTDTKLRGELKAEYETVKAALQKPPKTLGEHLDRLQAEGATN